MTKFVEFAALVLNNLSIDVYLCVGTEGCGSSASSTPRDGSSSGSPSPVPDDFAGESGVHPKPRVALG